jgi:hypothetical protein
MSQVLPVRGLYPALSVLSFDTRILANLDPLGIPAAL